MQRHYAMPPGRDISHASGYFTRPSLIVRALYIIYKDIFFKVLEEELLLQRDFSSHFIDYRYVSCFPLL